MSGAAPVPTVFFTDVFQLDQNCIHGLLTFGNTVDFLITGYQVGQQSIDLRLLLLLRQGYDLDPGTGQRIVLLVALDRRIGLRLGHGILAVGQPPQSRIGIITDTLLKFFDFCLFPGQACLLIALGLLGTAHPAGHGTGATASDSPPGCGLADVAAEDQPSDHAPDGTHDSATGSNFGGTLGGFGETAA